MEEGTKGGDLEKERLHAPQRCRGWWGGGSPQTQPALRPSRETFSWSFDDRGGTLITRKESLGDTAVIRLGYPLPQSSFPLDPTPPTHSAFTSVPKMLPTLWSCFLSLMPLSAP